MIHNVSLFPLLKKNSLDNPGKTLFFDEHNTYTNKEVYTIVLNLARFFKRKKVTSDSRICFELEQGLKSVFLFLALEAIDCEIGFFKKEEVKKERYDFEVYQNDDIYILYDVKHDLNIPIKWKDYLLPFNIKKGDLLKNYSFQNNNLNTIPEKSIFEPKKEDLNENYGDIMTRSLLKPWGVVQIILAIKQRHSLFVPKDLSPQYLVSSIQKYHISLFCGTKEIYKEVLDECQGNFSLLNTIRLGFLVADKEDEESIDRIKRVVPFNLTVADLNGAQYE